MPTPTDSDACSRSAGFVVYNNSSPESTYRLPHTGELHRGIVALARRGSPFLVQHCRTGELVLARRTFLREYGSLARVSHPHVARIRCVFDLEPQSILIQELLSLSLFELVPLSEVELASGLSQVGEQTHDCRATSKISLARLSFPEVAWAARNEMRRGADCFSHSDKTETLQWPQEEEKHLGLHGLS
ncbi:hypothetical protein AUP68_13971 [Ilyonectria robusta]